MPTVSKSGTRSAKRRNWRVGDQARSRPGPRSQPRPNPFAELGFALDALIRFHQSHPDWFPPPANRLGDPPPAKLSPEWEEAIRKAYQLGPDEPLTDVSTSADGRDGRAAPSASSRDQN